MPTLQFLEIGDGLCTFRPQGKYSLLDSMEMVSRAISYCRSQGVKKLLVDARGIVGLPIPTLVDRFLMVEEWADAAKGTVVAVMVVQAEYIHPEKIGVNFAADFGLVCDVYASEEDALRWLHEVGTHASRSEE